MEEKTGETKGEGRCTCSLLDVLDCAFFFGELCCHGFPVFPIAEVEQQGTHGDFEADPPVGLHQCQAQQTDGDDHGGSADAPL